MGVFLGPQKWTHYRGGYELPECEIRFQSEGLFPSQIEEEHLVKKEFWACPEHPSLQLLEIRWQLPSHFKVKKMAGRCDFRIQNVPKNGVQKCMIM